MAVTFSDTRMRDRIQLVFSLGIFALVALLPAIVRNEYWQGVLIVSMYFAMLAAAWNLLAGYTGQFSLAPAAFGMIGAYATGLLSYHFNAPPLVGIPAAVVVAAAIGFALGRIVLRLRGPYLALTTLSFAEIVRLVISNSIEITRGDLGLNVPALFDHRLTWYYVMLGVLVVIQFGLYFLLRAPAGLYLRAIRDDEIAAASRGVKIVLWKTNAFTLSAAISGLAGALYGHFAQFVSPELGLLRRPALSSAWWSSAAWAPLPARSAAPSWSMSPPSSCATSAAISSSCSRCLSSFSAASSAKACGVSSAGPSNAPRGRPAPRRSAAE